MTSNQRILSNISSKGRLELWLQDEDLPEPIGDELVVRIEAAPINPADLLQLVGPADLGTLHSSGSAAAPRLAADVPPDRLAALRPRLDVPLRVGNEGAGTVVDAGPEAAALVGRVVAFRDDAFARYRTLGADECLVLAEGTTALEGASACINPMTVLCMLETMRQEGHTALVHTAAASNLGQMLVRACAADDVPLVNIVRSAHQVELLRALGARHVLDSTEPGFFEALVDALDVTGATLAFDAIGGGTLAGTVLRAMEAAQARRMATFSRYGSRVHKQVYVYGVLDPSPRVIEGHVGTAWAIGGWLMSWALEKIAEERRAALRARVVADITTTFRSDYAAQLSLADALRPDTLRAYGRPATGRKFVIVPHLDAARTA